VKPLQHAKISAHKHGGTWSDYMDIHEFLDQTKAHVADMRHRAILHNSFGIYLAQQVFGMVRTNSDGREYSVRDIAEDHVLEDLGRIPDLAQVIKAIDTSHLRWLGGLPQNKRTLVTKQPRQRQERKLPEGVEETTTVFNGRTVPILKLKDGTEAIVQEGACTTCGMEDGKHDAGCSAEGVERPLVSEEEEGVICTRESMQD
jgi:hypothetical protein